MFCQTTEAGGSSKRLVRALPVNPASGGSKKLLNGTERTKQAIARQYCKITPMPPPPQILWSAKLSAFLTSIELHAAMQNHIKAAFN